MRESGLRADPEKFAAVANWKPPRNVPEMRSFPSLANHLKRYIKDISVLTPPLVQLTRLLIHFDIANNELAWHSFELSQWYSAKKGINDKRPPKLGKCCQKEQSMSRWSSLLPLISPVKKTSILEAEQTGRYGEFFHRFHKFFCQLRTEQQSHWYNLEFPSSMQEELFIEAQIAL